MKYRVIENLCDVCASCASVCLQDAIRISEQTATIIFEKCIGCSNCYIVCPISAIEEVEDEA